MVQPKALELKYTVIEYCNIMFECKIMFYYLLQTFVCHWRLGLAEVENLLNILELAI